MVPLGKGGMYSVHSNLGAILLQLLPSTKSSRSKEVDVAIDFQIAFSLNFGF